MTPIAERAARLALSTFDALPQKCKPRTLPDGRREWTPMAAVVLARAGDDPELDCVALATGTKCLSSSALPDCRGLVLHDCHAEVLALRGFNYWLLSEVEKLLESPEYESPFLESADHCSADDQFVLLSTPRAPFRLKPTVMVYFFTTEAPCGDASMEILMSSMPPGEAAPWPVEEDATTILQGRGHFSLLGHVRRKPARADAEPSLSKSCTDKLALKQFTSLISFPADHLVQRTENAFIRSVIVYSDQFNYDGYARAFSRSGRLCKLEHLGQFFTVEALNPDFPRFPFSKSDAKQELRSGSKSKASNISALFIRSSQRGHKDVLEILVNGVKQGYKQWDERQGKASVVSRKRLWQYALEIANTVHSPKNPSGRDDRRAMNDEEWHLSLERSLGQATYGAAKSTTSRSTYIERKQLVTDFLGNWSKNQGDDGWSLQ
ncbi:hypothetical protein HRR83_006999 [Exophiala dermatitidis]|uniref:A to I editase domain-containing protein n=1 Tax=Exophiala dermatitidis TaxID=5970 RepID=A0AAN6EQD0_EXODE|nr:hypothetical protein HRR73_006038 [Exophiala dermatitidis]KAJ4512643.1 hypothetical protein HRR74_006341 [Exophiala dermatitidis]KAJ4542443.1 hypothetical protein HRR77_005645 [Exophiala dermatitidis]KAJ4548130.1 hypothetical protein HRR76_000742 [Exophiala dermatitidis]KAJ4568114.1 hypothetical protein HRR82_008019 [Exophiala dermatitidis]